MIDKAIYFNAQLIGQGIASALGGWAFGSWQDSTAAGWFMFFALDAVCDIGLGLRHLAYKFKDF